MRHAPRIRRIYDATLNSFRGLVHATRSEAALQDELIALLIALPAGVFAAPTVAWYVAMIGVLLFVIAVELLNTGLEKLADHVSPDWNRDIGIVKDIASAAVFFALLLAVLVWGAAIALRLNLL